VTKIIHRKKANTVHFVYNQNLYPEINSTETQRPIIIPNCLTQNIKSTEL